MPPSKSQTALGTQLFIGGATSAGGFTGATLLIGEVTKLPFQLPKWNTKPTTHMQSTTEQAKPVIKGITTMEIEANFLPTDAGQVALFAAYQAALTSPYDFKVAFPIDESDGETTAGCIGTWSAFVLQLGFGDLTPDGIIPLKISMQLDDDINFSLGS